MAIIKTNHEFPIGTENPIDQHTPIILDLESRNFSDLGGYIKAVVGDSKSQVLTFRVPLEYDGIDLFGTSCVLTYWTSWTFELEGGLYHSKGFILLEGKEVTDPQTSEKWLEYTWTLTPHQTLKSGYCKFTLTFYLNLNENLYYNHNVLEITPEYSEDKGWYLPTVNVESDEYNYYSLSSNSAQFPIVDPQMGTGIKDISLPDAWAASVERRLNTIEKSALVKNLYNTEVE